MSKQIFTIAGHGCESYDFVSVYDDLPDAITAVEHEIDALAEETEMPRPNVVFFKPSTDIEGNEEWKARVYDWEFVITKVVFTDNPDVPF